MKNSSKTHGAILLISPNFTPEPTGIGKVNGEMINWFAKNGFNCDVITVYP
jgi:colanic acid biosynthesis glycosyl transferase WcaI